ncbi:MAG: FAD-dependent oxidoreductase [Candidatus Omnitrophota bacterium]
MSKRRILVLGAGLAGLTAVWHLRNKKIDALVLEKEDEIGGLCRTKHVRGFTFDHDGHLLHFQSPAVRRFVRSLLKDNIAEHQRKAWVYHAKQYVPYPFQTHLAALPQDVKEECLRGYLDALSAEGGRTKSRDFQDWVTKTFGKGIAKNFMMPYNSKFWTVSPNKLTCEWLDGFMPQPSASQVISGAFKTSANGAFGYNARFWYPKTGGIQALITAMARPLKNCICRAAVTAIDTEKKEVTVNGVEKIKYDSCISTLPLNEMSNMIPGLPRDIKNVLGLLRWNSIFNLNLGFKARQRNDRHWVYFPQKDLSFFRVGFPHNFSKKATPSGTHSLYAEAAYSRHRPLPKNTIIQAMIRDLVKTGLLGSQNDILACDTNDITYGYPIYDKNYSFARRKAIEFLRKKNIHCCGRYGSWRYLSMEGTILDAQSTAGRIQQA